MYAVMEMRSLFGLVLTVASMLAILHVGIINTMPVCTVQTEVMLKGLNKHYNINCLFLPMYIEEKKHLFNDRSRSDHFFREMLLR